MVDVDSAARTDSRQTIHILLPVLLQQGLSSTVDTVQAIT